MSQPCRPRRAHRAPLLPDRVRRIERGFAFLPNRFLHQGFFAALGHTERSLYFFLVLAGDRNGVSFYSYDRICATLEITLDDYIEARNALIDQDLVAFDGSCFQVLSLPPRPVLRPRRPLLSPEELERDDPATVRLLARSSLDQG
jgi:hypothetical protein